MLVPPCVADEVAADDGGGAEAKERGHDVEAADQDHGPDHAVARGLRVGHGVEPDQNVRQAGGSKDQAPGPARSDRARHKAA